MTISNIWRKFSPYLFMATMFFFLTRDNKEVNINWIWLLVAVFFVNMFFSRLGEKFSKNKLKNKQRFEKYHEKPCTTR